MPFPSQDNSEIPSYRPAGGLNDLDKKTFDNFYLYSSKEKAIEAINKSIAEMGTHKTKVTEYYVMLTMHEGSTTVYQVSESNSGSNPMWLVESLSFHDAKGEYIKITKDTTGYLTIGDEESIVLIKGSNSEEYRVLDRTKKVTKNAEGQTVTREWVKIKYKSAIGEECWIFTGEDIDNAEDIVYDTITLTEPADGYRKDPSSPSADDDQPSFIPAGEYRVLDSRTSSVSNKSWFKIIYGGETFWVLSDTATTVASSSATAANTDNLSGTTLTSPYNKNVHYCSILPPQVATTLMLYHNGGQYLVHLDGSVIPNGATEDLIQGATTGGSYFSNLLKNANGSDNSDTESIYSNLFNSYIINKITGSRINFFMPNDISDNVSANFDAHDVRGASMQVHGYNSTGARGISFSVELLADYTEEDMYATIAKFKALAYPMYTGNVIPPWCIIKLGDIIKADRFIVNSVSVSYDGNSAIIDNMYTHATVSIDAVWVPPVSWPASDIERYYNAFSGNTPSTFTPAYSNAGLVNASELVV